jgi:hypothetical protein
MRLDNVDDDEVKPVVVTGKNVVGGSDPLPEGRSGEGAEYHHYRLFRQEPG